ncbi:hypothetical protein HW555_006135, partial [Spodoptera exigua]
SAGVFTDTTTPLYDTTCNRTIARIRRFGEWTSENTLDSRYIKGILKEILAGHDLDSLSDESRDIIKLDQNMSTTSRIRPTLTPPMHRLGPDHRFAWYRRKANTTTKRSDLETFQFLDSGCRLYEQMTGKDALFEPQHAKSRIQQTPESLLELYSTFPNPSWNGFVNCHFTFSIYLTIFKQ